MRYLLYTPVLQYTCPCLIKKSDKKVIIGQQCENQLRGARKGQDTVVKTIQRDFIKCDTFVRGKKDVVSWQLAFGYLSVKSAVRRSRNISLHLLVVINSCHYSGPKLNHFRPAP